MGTVSAPGSGAAIAHRRAAARGKSERSHHRPARQGTRHFQVIGVVGKRKRFTGKNPPHSRSLRLPRIMEPMTVARNARVRVVVMPAVRKSPSNDSQIKHAPLIQTRTDNGTTKQPRHFHVLNIQLLKLDICQIKLSESLHVLKNAFQQNT